MEDGDKNIYLYIFSNEKLSVESVGVSISITSFYDSDKKALAVGSIIDPKDNSESQFLKNINYYNTPMFDDYMTNAGNGGKYDFKVTNGEVNSTKKYNPYRGLPIGSNRKGQIVYTSARDVGNIAAGYVAAANGMSWTASRMAFNAYQPKVYLLVMQNTMGGELEIAHHHFKKLLT